MAQDRRGARRPRRELLTASDVARTVARIAHQIIEKTAGTENVVLVGIPTRGAMLARRLGAAVAEFSGTAVPGRHRRSHAVPRRPAPPPGAAAVEHRHPRRRPRRRAGRAHRRRPDVRPHRAGRARRPRRPRPTPRGAAGRARRPRAPGAADPGRLRGQERAHRPRRAGQGAARRRSTGSTRCGWSAHEAPALGHRPRRRRRDRAAGHRRPAAPGAAGPRGAQAADAARPHRDHDVLRELDPHPGVVRGGGQVDERRHRERQRLGLVGGEGGVAARHGAHPLRDGRRLRDRAAPRVRRGPPARRVGRQGPGDDGHADRRSSTRATAPTSTPRRRCWTRPRCATGSAASPGSGSGSSATSCTAGSPAPTSSCSRRSAPRSCWSRRRRCCPSGWRSGPVG